MGGFPAHLAVDFFLVLSGFILSHRYLYGDRVGLRDFVVARLARLYPLHLLTLILFAGLYLVRFRELPSYQEGTLATFLAHLLLLQNVGLTPSELSWNAPSWSISVEFWVNIGFIALITRQTPSWLLGSIAVAGLATMAVQSGTLAVSLPNYWGFANSGLTRGACSFLLGVIAHRMYLRRAQVQGDEARVRPFAVSALLLLAGGLMLVPRPALPLLDFLAPPLFFAVVVACAFDSKRWMRWMGPLSHLGVISYSVYLLHYPIYFSLRFLKEFAWGTKADALWVNVVNSPAGCFVLYISLVLMLSHLTYVYFEIPSRRFVRNVGTSKSMRGVGREVVEAKH